MKICQEIMMCIFKGRSGGTLSNQLGTNRNKTGQAGLEAVFQVPMPGDSGSSPDAGSISNYCLTQEIFHSNPSELLSFNKSEKVLWTLAKYYYYYYYIVNSQYF